MRYLRNCVDATHRNKLHEKAIGLHRDQCVDSKAEYLSRQAAGEREGVHGVAGNQGEEGDDARRRDRENGCDAESIRLKIAELRGLYEDMEMAPPDRGDDDRVKNLQEIYASVLRNAVKCSSTSNAVHDTNVKTSAELYMKLQRFKRPSEVAEPPPVQVSERDARAQRRNSGTLIIFSYPTFSKFLRYLFIPHSL